MFFEICKIIENMSFSTPSTTVVKISLHAANLYKMVTQKTLRACENKQVLKK